MIDFATVQTLTLAGERFVVLPEAEFLRMAGEPPEPELPPLNERGNRPETLNRIETAKRSPSLSTFDKVHRALQAGEAKQMAARDKGKSRKTR